MPARTAARSLPRRVLDPPSLPRDTFHELANRLSMLRLTAHVEGRERSGRAAAPLREIEELAAQCGALLAATRSLVGFRPGSRQRVAPVTILDGLAGALADRCSDRVSLRVVRSRGLPDVRVDAELLHHLLIALAYGALEAVRPRGRVRLSARKAGGRVALVLEDDAEPIDLAIADGAPPRAGRALGLRLATALLARSGARVALAPLRRGNRIELLLPAAAGRSVRRPA